MKYLIIILIFLFACKQDFYYVTFKIDSIELTDTSKVIKYHFISNYSADVKYYLIFGVDKAKNDSVYLQKRINSGNTYLDYNYRKVANNLTYISICFIDIH